MSLPAYLRVKGKRLIRNGLIFKHLISKQGGLDTELHPKEQRGKTEERTMVLRMAVFHREAAAPHLHILGSLSLQSHVNKRSVLLHYWCRGQGRGGENHC